MLQIHNWLRRFTSRYRQPTPQSDPPLFFELPPYGETFFHHPTGRCSDGSLIIDFIDRKRFLEASLMIVGEIGGNDYNHALLQGKSKESVETFVPQVVKAITSTISELIKLGAVTLMVPGNFPIGCSATYLTRFKSLNQNDYDPKTGCINWLNKFASYHNKLLQSEISRIQQENPSTTIIYADYYNAAMRFYGSPQKYGFAKGGLAACCGGCGPYSLVPSLHGKQACENPSEYVCWDGLHLTEAAYRVIASGLMQESYTIPKLNSLCALSPKYDAVGLSDH